jgi:hypothetical protein
MARCLNTSRLLMTGEWLERSSNSDSSSIIYRTSTSELPITKLNSRGCHKPRPQRKDIWSLPISIITQQTSVSSVPPTPEEG